MKKIQLLDTHTVNKIAAGEVVERPSSVVKELTENSIDAQASAVTIEIKDGGISFIRITDNGAGIPKDEVKTAFLSHATSKIKNVEDLEEILSLGFRGEALASIAAVSQIEMITKTQDEETGIRIEIDGGEMISMEEIGCPQGTTIIVQNLFYNVPARRKFLKKPSTEGGYISDIVNKLALGHPEISFKYINNNTTILHTSGNNDLKTAVFYVYGKELSMKMIEIGYSDKNYCLKGLIGKPESARANRSYENLFINHRFVKSEIISSAVEDAYKNRLLIGKFPVFVLNFEISPSYVDVNVHPTKLEVRFHNDEEIYQFIYEAVTNVLKKHILIPESDWNSRPSKDVASYLEAKAEKKPVQEKLDSKLLKESKQITYPVIQNTAIKNKKDDDTLYIKEEQEPYVVESAKDIVIEKEENNILEVVSLESEKTSYEPFFNQYRIIGQIFHTYWIVEQNESMFMIDQHAAHERILFEELLEKLKKESILSQRLLQPVILNLTAKECEVLKDNLDLLQKLGFEVEEFGLESYALQSVPYLFKNPANVNFFTELLDTLNQNESDIESIYDMKLLSIATMACKSAVKANDKLTVQEAVSMIEKLLKLENPFNCPHGRPTIIELTKYELEKKFKRIQD